MMTPSYFIVWVCMPDLQPMSIDSSYEPRDSVDVFNSYDGMAQGHNQKIDGKKLINQGIKFVADHPELMAALAL
ncbi:hypothetical protein [Legionella shakespearei]|uniref:Uncharacterized protein n=1 Tax=Legionella shakespearei DSM 23087 TaxID=1122169 RepID=A0A0W0YLB2_9GAMM|nr:hypothetical protein [Legionella shakespearei]KTD57487.1 hypothetical protein Lsha_2328 [Legionella shakespearei DSM 23087]